MPAVVLRALPIKGIRVLHTDHAISRGWAPLSRATALSGRGRVDHRMQKDRQRRGWEKMAQPHCLLSPRRQDRMWGKNMDSGVSGLGDSRTSTYYISTSLTVIIHRMGTATATFWVALKIEGNK